MALGYGIQKRLKPSKQCAKPPNVRDVVQGQAHGDLKLCGRHVHASDGLGDWMFHLKTGVQLQEAKGMRLRTLL